MTKSGRKKPYCPRHPFIMLGFCCLVQWVGLLLVVHLVVTTTGNTAQRCCRMFWSQMRFNTIFMLSNEETIPEHVCIGARVLSVDHSRCSATCHFCDPYLLYLEGRYLFLLLQQWSPDLLFDNSHALSQLTLQRSVNNAICCHSS